MGPKVCASCRNLRKLAVAMKMPEASVYKYRYTMLRKDNVRGAGKFFIVEAESKSGCVKGFSDRQLWFGVFGPDASHHYAAFFG